MKQYNFVHRLWRKLRQAERIESLGWRVRRAERIRDSANKNADQWKKRFDELFFELARSQHRQFIRNTKDRIPGSIKTPYDA